MEIHIQLAGVELGPYTEAQVREYIADGLLAPGDPARYAGTEKWETVSEVLAKPAPVKLPVVEAKPESVKLPAVEVKPEPIVVVPPVSTTSEPIAPIDKPVPLKSEPITVAAKPQVTARAGTPLVVKSFGKKVVPTPKITLVQNTAHSSSPATAPIPALTEKPKETPPPAQPAPVKIVLRKQDATIRLQPLTSPEKTSGLLPAPIKVIPKTDEGAKPPPLTPSTTAPMASPDRITPPVEKTSALLPSPVKVVPQTDDSAKLAPVTPAEISIKASPDTAAPPPEKTSALLPTPIKVIPKTDEGVKTPPVEPSETSPEKVEKKMGKISALLPSAIKLFTRKTSAIVKPLPTPPTEPSLAPPPDKAEKPPEKISALLPPPVKITSKEKEPLVETKPEPAPAPFQPLPVKVIQEKEPLGETKPEPAPAPSQPLPVKVIPKKSEPATVEPPAAVVVPGPAPVPVSAPTPPPKTEPEVKTAEPVTKAAETPPTEPPVKKIVLPTGPPRKRVRYRRTALGVAYTLGGIILLAIIYVALAYYSAFSLLKAMKDGNVDELKSSVDFDSVRLSLKEQIEAQAPKPVNPDTDNGPQVDPAAAVRSMMENSIELYITPTGISALVNKSDQPEKSDQGTTVTPEVAEKILDNLMSQPVKSQGLAAFDDFVIDLDVAKLHLQYYWPAWKLQRVEVKSDVPLTTLPAEQPASAGLVAPTPPPAPTAPPAPEPQPTPPAPPSPPTPAPTPSATDTASLASPVIETYLSQGNVRMQKNDWPGAIDNYSKVLAINPRSDEASIVAYSNRALAFKAQGQLDGAIADYTKALELNPKMAETYFNRGEAELAKEDTDSAAADYTQAINLDAKMTNAFDRRGGIRLDKGDLDGAITDFTQELTLDQNSLQAYKNRGGARQKKGDLDGAIDDFTKALAINPQVAVLYFNRGRAKQDQGNLDAAILDFDQAIEYDPKAAGAYYNRANAKNAKHDFDGAIADYSKDLELMPRTPKAFCFRGLARQAKGDLDGAILDYTQAISLDPKNPELAIAYCNRGLIKEQKNDLDGAIADSSRAIELDPKQTSAYYNRGFAKLTKGNLAGAGADLKKYCELAPRDHYSDHARLYLWLITKAQDPKADANQDLIDSLQNDWNSAPDDLVSKLASFLLERMSESDLIATASSPDAKKDQGQYCEVWYFAGMKRLLAGDRATAIQYFHKCVATGEKDYCEYILAQTELGVLEPTPAPAPTPSPK